MKTPLRHRHLAALILLSPFTPAQASANISDMRGEARAFSMGGAIARDNPPAAYIGGAVFARAIDQTDVPIMQIDATIDPISAATDASHIPAPHRDAPLQIGKGITVPEPDLDYSKIRWQRMDIGWVGHFAIRAAGAETLRASLAVHGDDGETPLSDEIAQKIIFRIAGNDQNVFEVRAKEIRDSANYWTPLTPGDTIHIEVVAPHAVHPATFRIRVPRLSYFSDALASTRYAASGTARYAQQFYGAGTCHRDVVCRPQTAALRNARDAVAKMVYTEANGKTYMCTGTLLNNGQVPKRALFLTSRHCIQTQSDADSLLTIWFYQTTQCGGPPASIDPRITQLGGGATLLSAHPLLDMALLSLNHAPPAGAHYQGWSAKPLKRGEPITAIHHPAGDAKKHAIGTIADIGLYHPERERARITVRWGMADDAGATEDGSSGSGIFTADAEGVALRGTLNGGWSHCGASFARKIDYYAPFSDFYPSVSHYFGLLD